MAYGRARSGFEWLVACQKGGKATKEGGGKKPKGGPKGGAPTPEEPEGFTSIGHLADIGKTIAAGADERKPKKEPKMPTAKKGKKLPVEELEEEEEPETAWQGPDDGTRRRMEKVLSDLFVPVEEQVAFSIKYVKEGAEATLLDALRLWEEAAEAYKEHRMGNLKGESDEELAEKRQRCLDAAKAMAAVDDVAAFKGQPFTEIFASHGVSESAA